VPFPFEKNIAREAGLKKGEKRLCYTLGGERTKKQFDEWETRNTAWRKKD